MTHSKYSVVCSAHPLLRTLVAGELKSEKENNFHVLRTIKERVEHRVGR